MNVLLTVRALIEVRTFSTGLKLLDKPIAMTFGTAIPTMRHCENLEIFTRTIHEAIIEEGKKQVINRLKTERELQRMVGRVAWRIDPVSFQLFSSMEQFEEAVAAGGLVDKTHICHDIDFMRLMVLDTFRNQGGDEYFTEFLDNL